MRRVVSTISALLFLAGCLNAALAQDIDQAAQAKLKALNGLATPVAWHWRVKTADVPGGQKPTLDDSSWSKRDGSSFEWGPQVNAWLRTRLTVPEMLGPVKVNGGPLTFHCGIDDDGVLYVNGKEALKFHWDECRYVLTEDAEPGQTFDIAIKGINTGGPGRLLVASIEYAPLDEVREAASAYLRRVDSARGLFSACEEKVREPYKTFLADSLAQVDTDALEVGRSDDFLASLTKAGAPLDRVGELARHITIHLVGHAHIDMNWLWLWPETIDVCRNTFSTACKLMDEFPGFVFSQDQPATYLAMQEHAPEVVALIKDRIKRGQWDATASCWTEGDLNMSSGESIVRSILYGKRYMKREFGVEPLICWEPDTFGHPWTMPQIIAKSGMRYYYHMRCGSGHPLYWWQSPDGSRVLAFNYGSYNGDIGEGIARDAANFARQTGVSDFMYVYGVGDHGGGPTREMLKTATELSKRENYPTIKFSKASDYYETVLKKKTDFPVHNGELNTVFEGCYTTHSDIKRWNRELESLLPCAEKLGCISSGNYSRKAIEDSWRKTGFNQFHDLLCGSAIHGSYDHSRQLYEEAAAQAQSAVGKSFDSLTARIKTDGRSGVPVVVFNPLSWTRTDTVEIASPFPGQDSYLKVTDGQGKSYPARSMGDRLSFTARDVPSLGYKVFWVSRTGKPVANGVKTAPTVIENQFLRITVGRKSGAIESIYDKVNRREVLPPGGASVLQILMEKPRGMSAWAVGAIESTKDLVGDSEVVLFDAGPSRAMLTFDHSFGKSQFTQEVTLYDGVPRLDIHIAADWQEIGTNDSPSPMLKLALPTSLKDARAAFEIPFGSIERPANGAEVPAQKWIDLSTPDYGVSLLNDCKYGFDVSGSTMRASLLRASYDPDPIPDKGIHEMTISVYPHKGDWKAAGTVRRGYELNEPLIAKATSAHKGSLPASGSFISVSEPSIVVTALKLAEDDDSFILRFYETAGKACTTAIRMNLPVRNAVETDLMERVTGKKMPVRKGLLTVKVGKHEIKTLKLLRR